ncbi:hypothetical protein EJ06DRAFT_585750 [Trichodelitschia bisporula]|uniref:BTB domain-containing protein n=1 Tax=Trichodelitschia bisporula TaxID=703511 RepID=A0A6G1HJ62_9PEZI|nr:hypothetical protein EJ06DRAFT_585750 [Trichodelitschia bisporula]
MADTIGEASTPAPAAGDAPTTTTGADVEMTGAENIEVIEVDKEEVLDDEPEEKQPVRVTFLDHLKSPVVDIFVGSGDDAAVLHAHQAMLVKSPWFAEQVKAFVDDERVISLPSEDIDAVGFALEWLYNGEYFPRQGRVPQFREKARGSGSAEDTIRATPVVHGGRKRVRTSHG